VDATAAIQAAINACNATGRGGIVYLPYGFYKISAPLNINGMNFVELLGDGNGTRLCPTAAFAGAAAIVVTGGTRNAVNDLDIQYNNGTWSNNPAADGIQVAHSQQFKSDNVEVIWANGYGINVLTDATGDSSWAQISRLTTTYGRGGVNLQGYPARSTTLVASVTECFFNNAQTFPAINIQDAIHVNIDKCTIWGNQTGGIIISGACASIFIDSVDAGSYSGATTTDLLIQASGGNIPGDIYVANSFFSGGLYATQIAAGTRVCFTNCAFAWAQNHGLYCSGAANTNFVSVINCIFYNNARTAGTYYELFWAGNGFINVVGCQFITWVNTTPTAGYVAASCNFTAGISNVSNCIFSNNAAAGTGSYAGRPTYSINNHNEPLSTFLRASFSQGLALTPSSASAGVPANGGTIATANVASARFSGAAAVTSVIMAPGTIDGQTITVINEGTGSITFAASGSNVANGSASSIGAGTSCTYIWSVRTSLWYPAAPAVGSTALYNNTVPVAWANTANDSLWHAYGGIITFTVAGAGADISVMALMVGRIQISNTSVNAILQGTILLDGVVQTACPYGIMAQTSGGGASGNVGGTWAFLALAPGVHTVQFAYWYNGTANAGQLSNGEVNVTVVQK
jgi:hypothetical protein